LIKTNLAEAPMPIRLSPDAAITSPPIAMQGNYTRRRRLATAQG